jgi:hypothetical protein
MCGDLEDEAAPEEEAHDRFVAHAHSFLAKLRKEGKSADATHAHLDKLFRELLIAATDERKAPREITGYQRLTMEPLVFARLAGFIAAHVPLHEDPLKRTIEALMLGYSEGEVVMASHDHEHEHPHGPGYGHTH